MQTISQLVDILGKDYLIKNVESFINIKYKKCSELEQEDTQKVIFETNYENNLDNAIKTVNNSIKLKAIDHIYVCSFVLEMLNPNYKQLLLEKADYILIKKGNFPLLTIVNNNNPKSGIYISCDIQYLQSNLEYANQKRWRDYGNRIICTILGLIVVAFDIGILSFIMKKDHESNKLPNAT